MSEGAHETAQDHEERIHALEKRIFALEEKERARDRAEYEQAMALDFKDSEGLSRVGLQPRDELGRFSLW